MLHNAVPPGTRILAANAREDGRALAAAANRALQDLAGDRIAGTGVLTMES